MKYDEALADRIRGALGPYPDVSEKTMFGGLTFLLGGKMLCGVVEHDLMVRVGPERYAAALAEANVRPMDFTGRPMNGYVFVGSAGVTSEQATGKWVAIAVAFVTTIDAGGKRKRKSNRNQCLNAVAIDADR